MKLPVFLIVLLTCYSTVAQKDWFPYQENGKLGWKTRNGAHLLPSSIRVVFGNTFIITQSRKYGMIDTSGKLVLDTIYSYLGPIENEHARPASQHNPNTDSLMLFVRWPEKENYGVMDRKGKVIVPAGYSAVQYVYPNLLALAKPIDPNKRNDRNVVYHFFDINQRSMLPMQLSEYVCSDHLVIGNRYDKARAYDQSAASGIVFTTEGTVLLDSLKKLSTGNVIPELYLNSDPMNTSLKPMVIVPASDFAYIFRYGKLIETIPLRWTKQKTGTSYYPVEDYVNAFSRFGEQAAKPATRMDFYGGSLEIETEDGNTIFNAKGDTLWHSDHCRVYANKLAIDTSGKWGIVNYDKEFGNLSLPFLFDSIVKKTETGEWMPYSGGREVYTYYDFWLLIDPHTGKYGLTDQQLHPLLPVEYDEIRIFGHFFKLRHDGKEGIVDSLLRPVLPLQYEAIQYFNDGYGVKQKGKWGYFDRSGKQLTAFRYDSLSSSWSGNFIQTYRKNKRGILNAEGKEQIAPKYDYVSPMGSGFRITHNRKKGLLDSEGRKLLPAIYKEMHSFDFDVYVVATDSTFRLYDLKSRKFFAGPFNYTDDEEYKLENISTWDVEGRTHVYFDTQLGGMEVLTDGTVVHGPDYGKIGPYFIKGEKYQAFYLEDNVGKRFGEGAFVEIQKAYNRFALLKGEAGNFLLDVLTGRMVATDCIALGETSYYIDTFPGFLTGQTAEGVVLYDTLFRKLNPVDFENEPGGNRYYSDNPTKLFFYKGSVRYTFDIRTLTFAEPIDLSRTFLDFKEEKILVEDCDSIERFSPDYGNYTSWKVTKGDKIYWYTLEKQLYHVSDTRPKPVKLR